MLHVVTRVLTHPRHLRAVRGDDSAVAGFFEDLPVLMFVLAGVLCLVLTSAWVSKVELQQKREAELERAAEDIAYRLLDFIRGSDPGAPFPMMDSIEGMDVSDAAGPDSGLGYSVAIVERYPDTSWMRTMTSGLCDGVMSTGSCCVMFNARDDLGNVVVLEVRVIVWQA